MATYTKDQVNKMTSEQYRENFNSDPAFREFVDTGMAVSTETRPAPALKPSNPRGRAELAVEMPEAVPAFDPSFDEDPNPPAAPAVAVEVPVEPIVPVPAVVVPPAPVELPEQTYEYFITDEANKPIGGKQVFKYRTQDELIEKLRDSNIHVRRMAQKLREEKLLNGTEVPAETTVAEPLSMRPVLSVEERTAWQEKLQDPATAAQAQYMLDRDDDRQVTNSQIQSNYETRVLLALESFKNRNRDYVPSQDNATKLIGYIERRGLDPTNARNYQKAFDVLRENGIITDASGNQVPEAALVSVPPTVREEKTVPNVAPVEATARISDPALPQKRPVAQIPSGLSNADQVSDVDNPIPQPNWLTVRVYLKDGKGKPTSQFQEFHNLEAVLRLEGKSEKEFYNSQTPEAKARREKYEAALLERETRLAAQKRKRGW
jgi:hypothetical protein